MLKLPPSATRKQKRGKRAMQADIPTHYHQERIECSIKAANHYHIPALVLLSVADQEGGKPGQKVRNSNGTYDYGVMQINTVSLADLKRFGINEHHVLANGCYPYYLAAWRIAGHLQNDEGDIWQRAANYHSRTPTYNRIYRLNLIRRAAKIASRLEAKQAAPELTANLFAQTAKPVKKIHFSQIKSPDFATSAPIRVIGFDRLNANPYQSHSLGTVGKTAATTEW